MSQRVAPAEPGVHLEHGRAAGGIDDRLHHGALEIPVQLRVEALLNEQDSSELFFSIDPEMRAERAVPSEAAGGAALAGKNRILDHFDREPEAHAAARGARRGGPSRPSVVTIDIRSSSGSGNGAVGYTVAANTGLGSRTGTITVADDGRGYNTEALGTSHGLQNMADRIGALGADILTSTPERSSAAGASSTRAAG